MVGKAKGNAYERYVAEELSLWWSNGKRADIFWRTDSGARAKKRGRAGKDTAYQAGDIVATDPLGNAFIDLITCELKRGYNKATLHDLLDKPSKAAKQEWEKWIDQAQESHEQAGSYSWMLIARRDRREAVVCIPEPLYNALAPMVYVIEPMLTFKLDVKNKLYLMHLSKFLEVIRPEDIKTLSRTC